jgi:hypothetical protein
VKHNLRLALAPLLVALCLILGGASGGGYWANMGLQLLAIPVIMWGLVARRSAPISSPSRQLLLLVALMVLVVLVQLIPLPPSLWTSLGGREEIARGFEMLGQPLPWLPLSLAPHKTVASALWMLPALAVLFAIVRLGAYKTSWLAATLILVTAVAVGLGALQLAGGENSSLYFYRFTNRGSAVGFFANANNMAELLVVAIPFVAMLYLARETRRLLAEVLGAAAGAGGALERAPGGHCGERLPCRHRTCRPDAWRFPPDDPVPPQAGADLGAGRGRCCCSPDRSR